MSALTDEQKRRIEENRRLALAKFEKRQQERNAVQNGEPVAKRPMFSVASTSTSTKPAPKQPPSSKNQNKNPFKERANSTLKAGTSTGVSVGVASPISGYMPKCNITFSLASARECKVSFHPFHNFIVQALKSVPSARYNKEQQCWFLEIKDHDKLLDRLRKITELKLQLDLLPSNIRKVFNLEFNNRPIQPFIPDFRRIDPSLFDVLFQYQKTGVAFGLEKRGRILLADEMGLGKSLQALAIARHFSSEWPLLIVCPSSVKYSWKQQIQRFLPQVDDLYIIEKSSEPLPETRSSRTVIIMSYEQLAIKLRKLIDSKVYVVIFDESHMLKDQKTKRAKAALELARVAQRRILLSGTPALSRPVELFSQVRIIEPTIFPNFIDFATRYCEGKQGKFGFEAKGASNLEELGAVLEKSVMIRRLKKDVLQDLPPKCRNVLYLTGSSIDEKLKSLKKLRDDVEKAIRNNDMGAKRESMMGYYMETGLVKSTVVADFLMQAYFYQDAPHCKLLLFGHHQVVLDTISNSLATNILIQAEDRAHRVGQKDSVFVQYIIARHTADDVIWPMIQSKLNVLQGANLNSENFGTMQRSKLFVDEVRSRIDEYFPPVDDAHLNVEVNVEEADDQRPNDTLDESIYILDD